MKKPLLIDTHCHLYLDEFAGDLEQVMERAGEQGVEALYMPSLRGEYIEEMLRVERLYPGRCFPMIGLHPGYVKEDVEAELTIMQEWLAKRSFAAVGEIGLDYYWDDTQKDRQALAFRRQIGMAKEYGLPIVIHSRSAMDDTLVILKEAAREGVRGIFHCFSGTLENANDIIDCGFLLGIGGVVTYKNAGLAEIIAKIPIAHLVLETDAPYLTPVPFRGKRNESSYLTHIVKKLSEVKGIGEDEIARVTTENAKRVFGKMKVEESGV